MTLNEKFKAFNNFVRKLADYGNKIVKGMIIFLASAVGLALLALLLKFLLS